MGKPGDAMLAAGLALTLVLAGAPAPSHAGLPPDFDESRDVWPTAVTPATCRSGDRVETGIQGEVPLADRDSGRSTEGYNCNIDLIGQYQGPGAGGPVRHTVIASISVRRSRTPRASRSSMSPTRLTLDQRKSFANRRWSTARGNR